MNPYNFDSCPTRWADIGCYLRAVIAIGGPS